MRSFILIFCLALFIGHSTQVSAQEISPLIFDLAPKGEGSFQSIEISNSGTAPIALEISAYRRTYDESGNISTVSGAQSFEITPDAIWVEPGGDGRVSVKWVGETELSESEMHILVFRQAPVRYASDEDTSGITLLYEFLAIAHVVPGGASADISLSEWRAGDAEVAVTFENTGNSYGRIDTGDLIIGDPDTCAVITREELSVNYEATWLLPGARRTLKLALPEDCNASGLDITWPVEPVEDEQ